MTALGKFAILEVAKQKDAKEAQSKKIARASSRVRKSFKSHQKRNK